MILSFLFSQNVCSVRLAPAPWKKNWTSASRYRCFDTIQKRLLSEFRRLVLKFCGIIFSSKISLGNIIVWLWSVIYYLLCFKGECCELSVSACLLIAGPLRSALRHASTCRGLHMSRGQFNVKIWSFNPCRLKKLWIHFFFSMSNNLDPEIICI